MALTLKEQLQIFDLSIDGTKVIDLVFQGLVVKSVNFLENTKDTNPVDPVNPTAEEVYAGSYKSKMVQKTTQIINIKANQGGGLIGTLNQIFASIVGKSQYNLAQVTGASEAAMEGFINNNALEIIEVVAGISKQEKDAYTALA